MEVGIGIHGEPGRRREPLGTARTVAAMMVAGRGRRPGAGPGTPVLVFTNSMGGTPLLELYVLHGEVAEHDDAVAVLGAARARADAAGVRAETAVGRAAGELDRHLGAGHLRREAWLPAAMSRLCDTTTIPTTLCVG